jgi:hypothetical protein
MIGKLSKRTTGYLPLDDRTIGKRALLLLVAKESWPPITQKRMLGISESIPGANPEFSCASLLLRHVFWLPRQVFLVPRRRVSSWSPERWYAGRGGQSSHVCELFHYARELQLHVALPLRARQSA